MKKEKIFGRPFVWALIYSVLLFGFTLYSLLDTFVIPRAYVIIDDSDESETASVMIVTSGDDTVDGSTDSDSVADVSEAADVSPVVTENTYSDQNITITITEYREYDTEIYVADITLSDISYLQTAFAKNTYGKNVTQKTSTIAAAHDAILAINGDYYGAQIKGYVLRNGTIYRSNTYSSSREDLVIYEDGTFDIVSEGSVTLDTLEENGALQVLSFGPGLIEDGEITVTAGEEVDKAMASNPRTAIGMISPLHYIMVVSDGRTDESAGMTLCQLAEFMQGLGVEYAYNLDGGGSSTMYFNGEIVNNPTTNGKISERNVSDIVYIGY